MNSNAVPTHGAMYGSFAPNSKPCFGVNPAVHSDDGNLYTIPPRSQSGIDNPYIAPRAMAPFTSMLKTSDVVNKLSMVNGGTGVHHAGPMRTRFSAQSPGVEPYLGGFRANSARTSHAQHDGGEDGMGAINTRYREQQRSLPYQPMAKRETFSVHDNKKIINQVNRRWMTYRRTSRNRDAGSLRGDIKPAVSLARAPFMRPSRADVHLDLNPSSSGVFSSADGPMNSAGSKVSMHDIQISVFGTNGRPRYD